MDEKYAEKLGLPILRGDAQRVKLVFADNSTTMTSGMVKGVRWSFGTTTREQEHILNFHILKNPPAPVILSDKLFFDTDAYSQYECYLEDKDNEDDETYLIAIDIDDNYLHEGMLYGCKVSKRLIVLTCSLQDVQALRQVNNMQSLYAEEKRKIVSHPSQLQKKTMHVAWRRNVTRSGSCKCSNRRHLLSRQGLLRGAQSMAVSRRYSRR